MNDGPSVKTGEGERPARPEERTPAERNVVGVKYAPNGRLIDCDSSQLQLRRGEQVVVDDRRGGGVATVVTPTSARRISGYLARIVRRAEPRDLQRAEADQQRQTSALTFARERARSLDLPIKVFRVDLGHGNDRATFYFSSEQRVDFRDLVRDLAAHLHTRIEMRQVGVRDEAKMVGGIGSCGRELCCSTFLPHFAPVSIKMAKNQRLVLNPTKVAGQCGRLKCCLMYEDALYAEASKGLPKVGKFVQTPEGLGRVDDLEVLTGKVRVAFPDRPPVTFLASEVQLAPRPGSGPAPQNRAPAPAERPTPEPHDLDHADNVDHEAAAGPEDELPDHDSAPADHDSAAPENAPADHDE
jgi:cell fate regulator YaaT (PSP1 superfamily)